MLFSSILRLSLGALAVRASPTSLSGLSKNDIVSSNKIVSRQLDLPDLQGPGVIESPDGPNDGELELDQPDPEAEWRKVSCDSPGVIDAGDDISWRCESRFENKKRCSEMENADAENRGRSQGW